MTDVEMLRQRGAGCRRTARGWCRSFPEAPPSRSESCAAARAAASPAQEPHPYRARNAVHPTMSRMSRGRWRVATLTKLLPSSPTLAAPVMLSGKVKSLLGEPGWNSSPAFTGTAMRAFALL